MTLQSVYQSAAIDTSHPMLPYWADIMEIKNEAPGIATYWLRFQDEAIRRGFSFRPGQFNKIYVPGYGEVAVSISSDPSHNEMIGHTVRAVGSVTNKIARMKVGDVVGLRGPFGTSWPLHQFKGNDIVISTGGIGIPPLRSALYEIMRDRADYGRVVLLYGARTPADLQFTNEFADWEKAGIEMLITVDRADETWSGQVGVVPILFYRLRMDPHKSVVFTCGPEIMIRFVIFEALARRISPERIYLSLERNMKCGLGQCGHCQIGPFFVCRDGPIFSFKDLQPYYNVEEL